MILIFKAGIFLALTLIYHISLYSLVIFPSKIFKRINNEFFKKNFNIKIINFISNGISLCGYNIIITLLQYLYNIEIIITGDIPVKKNSLFISNHPTELDWLWLFKYFSLEPSLFIRLVLKESIKKIPLFGWTLKLFNYLFIGRDWDKDKKSIKKYFIKSSKVNMNFISDCNSLLIFPEGTVIWKGSIDKSNKFAEENNLSKYTETIHPRTTGLQYIYDINKNTNFPFQNCYDLTISYYPVRPSNILELFKGKIPKKIFIKADKYEKDYIDSFDNISQWCNFCWKKKELYLRQQKILENSKIYDNRLENTIKSTFINSLLNIFHLFLFSLSFLLVWSYPKYYISYICAIFGYSFYAF